MYFISWFDKNQITGSYSLNGYQLAFVKSGKYLGVTLTDTLSWNNHVDQAINNSLLFSGGTCPAVQATLKQLPQSTVTAPTLETFKGGHPGHYQLYRNYIITSFTSGNTSLNFLFIVFNHASCAPCKYSQCNFRERLAITRRKRRNIQLHLSKPISFYLPLFRGHLLLTATITRL